MKESALLRSIEFAGNGKNEIIGRGHDKKKDEYYMYEYHIFPDFFIFMKSLFALTTARAESNLP